MHVTFEAVEVIARDRRDARLAEAKARRRMLAARNSRRELEARRLPLWRPSLLRTVRTTA